MVLIKKIEIFLSTLIMMFCVGASVFGADDYPYSNNCTQFVSNCVDPWEFYYRQCTSYVAWRMNRDAQTTIIPYSFYNTMSADNPTDPSRNRWSHAWHWDEHASDLGLTVSNTPVVGSVAQWNENEIGGGYGHVAYVEKVYPDGNVDISEYNINSFAYGVRRTRAPRYIYINATNLTVFNFNDGSSEGWTAGNAISNQDFESGKWVFNTSIDPYLISPRLAKGINAGQFRSVEVSISAAGDGRVENAYIYFDTGNGFNEAEKFHIGEIHTSGQSQLYVVGFPQIVIDENRPLSQIRLDPLYSEGLSYTPNDTVKLDFIRLISAYHYWYFEDSPLGWSLGNAVSEGFVDNWAWKIQATTGDPQLKSPWLGAVNTGSYDTIHLRFAVNRDQNTAGQHLPGKIYFDLYDDGVEGFVETLHADFSVLPDSSQHDYYVTIPATSKCTKIHQIRVDFYEGAVDEKYPIYVDRIEFTNSPPSGSSATLSEQHSSHDLQTTDAASDIYVTIHEIGEIGIPDNSPVSVQAFANGCCSDEYIWSLPQNPINLFVNINGHITGNSGDVSGSYVTTVRAEDKYDPTNYAERDFTITINNDGSANSIRIFNDGTASLDISSISIQNSSPWISMGLSDPLPMIDPGAYYDVYLSVDKQGLPIGNHNDVIIIHSNDANDNPVLIPINLQVDTDSSAPPAPQNLTCVPSYWFANGNVVIDWVNPSDPSGIAGAYYKVGNPPNSNEDGIFVSGKPIQFTPTIEGVNSLYLWLEDGSGNKSHHNINTVDFLFDASSPIVISRSPESGAVNIPIDTAIYLHIEDMHSGIDINSIVLKINDLDVLPVITGSPAGYSVSYKPPANFGYGEAIDILLEVSDLSSPTNIIPSMSWSFETTLAAVSPIVETFLLNYGDPDTNNRTITLDNSASGNPTEFIASELPDFSGGLWQPYSSDPNFSLSDGNGIKTVYFKLRNSAGESMTYSDSIILNDPGGSYSLSNNFIYLMGRDGYFNELRVDPTGNANYSQNIIHTAGKLDWTIDGGTFSNSNTIIQLQETGRIILNNQAGALWDIRLSNGQFTSSLNLAYTPFYVQIYLDTPYEDTGYFDYSQRYHWEFGNNHDAQEIPFKTFYSQTGQTRAIEYFMRNDDTGHYMQFRTNYIDDTQHEPTSGNNRLIAIGTGEFDIDFNDLPSHKIWMNKTDDMLILCSGQNTTARTINFGFQVAQINEFEDIEINEYGDKMPYFYTSSNEPITNVYGGQYTFDELLNRFYRQSAFYYTDVGLNVWWNWASQYTGFVDNWYRNKLKANLQTWEQGDDGYGNDGYMWSWPGNREWPMGDLYLAYDFRFLNTNALYIQATWNYYAWTGDNIFLSAQLTRLRDAMEYQLDWLGGGTEFLINGDNGYDLDHGGINNEDVGTNYWDIVPFGGKDAYCSIDFYKSLDAMANIEYVLGNIAESDSYRVLADQARNAYNNTFWSTAANRYIAAVDRLGNVHDYGFSFINVEALAAGLGDASKANHIYGWLNSGDIYSKWLLAPRTNDTTTQDLWRIPFNNNYAWEQQLQDGGANLYVSGYDIAARAKYTGADDAYARLKEILERYSEPDKLTGGSPTIFNETIQGGSDGPGSLGIMSHEFPESGIAGASFVYAFIGLSPQWDGLHIDPKLPSGQDYIGAKNINYHGMNLNFHIAPGIITIECTKNENIGDKYYVVNGISELFPIGLFTIEIQNYDFNNDDDVDGSDLAELCEKIEMGSIDNAEIAVGKYANRFGWMR